MQQQAQTSAERPYRSHLRPACVPCRRRKSRCQTEANSESCLTCKAHRTECFFPEGPRAQASSGVARRARRSDDSASAPSRGAAKATAVSATSFGNAASGTGTGTGTGTAAPMTTPGGFKLGQRHGGPDRNMPSTAKATTPPCVPESRHAQAQAQAQAQAHEEESPLALGSSDDHHVNLHIVGPAVTNDSQVLSDYLSGIPEATRSTRMVIPESASRCRPVLFTMVQKRPLGIAVNRSPSAEKLEVIEKLIEPHAEAVIDEYFDKANGCLPLLDEDSFRRQYREAKDRISPALLACLYAHALVYWRHSRTLSRHRCPDSRFVWNLANEAVYSELHLSPGTSIIKAILLNIGGRPTTSLIGNGVLLGSAVSMAHSLGLNHNPLPWKIPQSEKYLRMKMWWALLLHDRWISLAHGTPPHIARAQYDVPPPTLEYLCEGNPSEERVRTASVFIALAGLTDVLDRHLQHVYRVGGRDRSWDTTNLELSLNNWVESLTGSTRLIIIRGSHLDMAGAANLRLAYLTTRLLLQRIELESDKQTYGPGEERLMNRYIQARRTSEEILMLVQELQPRQLGDFWLSVSAFAFPATVNFLLRCALETESSPASLAQSTSFRIARDLIATLRSHQEKSGWDLADVCLAQHAEVVDKVLGGVAPDEQGGGGGMAEIQDFVMPDASIIDQFFPSLWDPLQNAW